MAATGATGATWAGPHGSGANVNDMLEGQMAREAQAPAIVGLKPIAAAPVGAPSAGASAAARPYNATPTLVGTIEGTLSSSHVVKSVGHHHNVKLNMAPVLRGGIVEGDEGLHSVEIGEQMHLGSMEVAVTNPTSSDLLVDVKDFGSKSHAMLLSDGTYAFGNFMVPAGERETRTIFATKDGAAGNAAAAVGIPDVAAITKTFRTPEGDKFQIAAHSPLFDYLQAVGASSSTANSAAVRQACDEAMRYRSEGTPKRGVYSLSEPVAMSYVAAIQAEHAKASSTSFDPTNIGLRFTRSYPWEALPPAFAHADADAPEVAAAAAVHTAIPPTIHCTVTAQVSAPVKSAKPLGSM